MADLSQVHRDHIKQNEVMHGGGILWSIPDVGQCETLGLTVRDPSLAEQSGQQGCYGILKDGKPVI